MNDLDSALRDMLRERSGDITTLPERLTTFPVPAIDDTRDRVGGRTTHRQPGPRRTGWLVAATVAAVLAIAAGTIGAIRLGTHHDHPAVTRTARPTPTVSPTPTPKPAPASRICTTTEPVSWRSAISSGTSSYGADSAMPLAFSTSGLVVARDFGSSRDLAIVGSDGTARHVYSVPDPNRNVVESAAVDGGSLVVPVEHLPRDANGVLGTVVRIDVVDLRTGAVRTVTTAPITITNGVEGRTIDGATIFRGTVYYDERATYSDRTADIHAYDVATRSDRVVGTSATNGPGEGPVTKAGGVFWSLSDTTPAIRAALPSAVDGALTSSRATASLVTDGTSYAWSPASDVIGFWSPSTGSVHTFRTGGRSDLPTAVAGAVVAFQDVKGASTDQRALDTRTAAVTTLTGVRYVTLAADGVLAGYHGTSPMQAVRVDATSLPRLSC